MARATNVLAAVRLAWYIYSPQSGRNRLPGGLSVAAHSRHQTRPSRYCLATVPGLFTFLEGLSRRSLRAIGDTEWHDSPAVYQQALDNVRVLYSWPR